MKIHNVRLGFANNSSSTHSVIFFKGKKIPQDRILGDQGEYGCENFMLSSQKEKARYFGTMIMTQLSESVGTYLASMLATQIM